MFRIFLLKNHPIAREGGGGPKKADELYSARMPHSAPMNPVGKGGVLPRLFSVPDYMTSVS
jgi:hypothetical protein